MVSKRHCTPLALLFTRNFEHLGEKLLNIFFFCYKNRMNTRILEKKEAAHTQRNSYRYLVKYMIFPWETRFLSRIQITDLLNLWFVLSTLNLFWGELNRAVLIRLKRKLLRLIKISSRSIRGFFSGTKLEVDIY